MMNFEQTENEKRKNPRPCKPRGASPISTLLNNLDSLLYMDALSLYSIILLDPLSSIAPPRRVVRGGTSKLKCFSLVFQDSRKNPGWLGFRGQSHPHIISVQFMIRVPVTRMGLEKGKAVILGDAIAFLSRNSGSTVTGMPKTLSFHG